MKSLHFIDFSTIFLGKFLYLFDCFILLQVNLETNSALMRNILYAFLCFFITSLTIEAHDYDARKWMSTLPDAALMVEISIPATHDSGAMFGGFSLKTQNATIQEQLDKGIRGFDMRLKPRKEGKLGVYHDIKFQKITWEEDVLPTMVNFLKSHPTETLWVSLKKEGGETDEYVKLITASLQNPELEKFIVKGVTSDLTLGECRGKILFVHRDTYLKQFPGMQCYNWPDNGTGPILLKTQDGVELKGAVEDEYKYERGKKADYKAELTWKHMQDAMHKLQEEKTWYISFASATALPKAGPAHFAKVVNPYLAKKTVAASRPCGIVLVDFSGSEEIEVLIENLILLNQKYFKK